MTTPIKHLIRIQRAEIGGVTRYHAACGHSGTVKREFTNLLTGTTCPRCAATVKTWKPSRTTEKANE